ncbi:MAG: tRNA uridine-5-carboxymethylaminomethyl(34) synthesis GTPase MnmE [Gammaproteobacteria bacterium]
MIYALSTPPGVSAIALIRLSGGGCIDAASRFLEKKPLKNNQALVTNFVASGSVVDRVVVVAFFAPRSFTGEDMLEISCHGSPLVISKIFSVLDGAGFVEALPGEFSERAFINGKLALNEAESIADLIHSSSAEEVDLIARSFGGSLQKSLNSMGEQIDALRCRVEASIDFADEDLGADDLLLLRSGIESLLVDVRAFVGSCHVINSKRKKKRVLLLGPPNSGKSSLFNRLVGFNRAIVSEKPGTTRDLLEQTALIDGVSVEFLDSAGIRISDDEIEMLGVEMIKDFAATADAIILLASVENIAFPESTLKDLGFGGLVIRVINKIDIKDFKGLGNIKHDYRISVKSGEGIADLIRGLKQSLGLSNSIDRDVSFSIRERHMSSLKDMLGSLDRALENCVEGSEEILAENLKITRSSLDFILGKKYTDDLLGDIFSNFCVGK